MSDKINQEKTPTVHLLYTFAHRIKDTCASAPGLEATSEIHVFHFYLAHLFSYHIKQGGFAQFLYNSRGNYLQEVDEMLSSAGARVALTYYQAAVRRCLDSIDQWEEFLNGDFVGENELKNALHQITIQYFQKDVDFIDEAKYYIHECIPLVQDWLNIHSVD